MVVLFMAKGAIQHHGWRIYIDCAGRLPSMATGFHPLVRERRIPAPLLLLPAGMTLY